MSGDVEKAYEADQKVASSVRSSPQESTQDDLASEHLDPAEEVKLLRKLDINIAPVLMVLYLISFLDRSNIGNALSAGMAEDLNLPTEGSNVAVSIFYVTYVVFESPLATLLKKLRPSRMIPFIVVAWGCVVIGSGFVKNYAGLIVCRLFLGAGEAALFPCLTLYLTLFYKRTELARRTCYLFVAAAISGAFGGLIAAGLLKMEGIANLHGWQWLYIIEGLLTVVIGFGVFWLLPDNFEHAWYLNDREKHLMRIRAEQTKAYLGVEEHYWREVKKALRDPSLYISGFCQLGADICLYGYSTFLVTILRGFGYDTIRANLMTAPAYAWAAIVYFCLAVISDRYQKRVAILMPLGTITVVGYAILLGVHDSNAVKYFACFVVGTGIYVTVGLNLTWLNQNQAGFLKRSTSLGCQQTLGNIGGVIAGQIYRSTGAPNYTVGHAVSLAGMSWAVIGFGVQAYLWKRRNARKDAMTEEEKAEQDAQGVTGDAHHTFRYVW